jgi:hypothetical protein
MRSCRFTAKTPSWLKQKCFSSQDRSNSPPEPGLRLAGRSRTPNCGESAPWVFVDHFGPTKQTDGMVVGSAPPRRAGTNRDLPFRRCIVEHRDSVGSQLRIRPGHPRHHDLGARHFAQRAFTAWPGRVARGSTVGCPARTRCAR